jgi:hypothetical protein
MQVTLLFARMNSLRFRLQDQYAHGFSAFKPDKKLRWLPHLGTVNLELELQDRVVTADVPPLEAAFIELFSDKSDGHQNTFRHELTDCCARYVDHGRAHLTSWYGRQERGSQSTGYLGRSWRSQGREGKYVHPAGDCRGADPCH